MTIIMICENESKSNENGLIIIITVKLLKNIMIMIMQET